MDYSGSNELEQPNNFDRIISIIQYIKYAQKRI